MKAHPASEIFPLMNVQEYTNLKNDIKEHGVREPVWVKNEILLDGRHRMRACTELGYPCPQREWPGKSEDATAFVISLNLKRRHLNSSQLSMVAAKIASMKQGTRTDLPSKEGKLSPISQATAAAMVGASVASTERAATVIRDGSAALVASVASGEVPVARAAEVAKSTPKKQQAKVAKEKKAPKPKPLASETVPRADYDKLAEEYTTLQEKSDNLGSMVEAYSSVTDGEQVTKLAELQLLLKNCKRERGTLMNEVADMQKKITYWQGQAKKLGWKSKDAKS